MTRHFHPSWREEHHLSKYPFADSASLQASSGIGMSHDTFVDAHLFPIGGGAGLHIPQITVFADRVRIYVGTSATPLLSYAEFDPLDPPEILKLQDQFGRPAGVIVASEIGLSIAQSWEQGNHIFSREATEFVASVCRPTPEIGLRGLITPDGDVLTGDVWLVGENGVVVREDPDRHIAGKNVIRIDIVGDPLFRRALCNASIDTPSGEVPLFNTINFLKTINGKKPDAYGNFTIQVGTGTVTDPVFRITPTADGLLFRAVGQKTEQAEAEDD